ncbi:MAG: PAS domain S-box protein [Rariglobus sp.]
MLTVDTPDLAIYVKHTNCSLLLSILDEVRDFVFIKDIDSRFLYNNRSHLANLGKTQKEVVGKNDFDLFPRHLAEAFYADETRLFDTRIPIIKMQESQNAKGERFFSSAIKQIVTNPRGETLGLVGIVRRIAMKDETGLGDTRDHLLDTLRREPGVTSSQLHAFEASLPSLLARR